MFNFLQYKKIYLIISSVVILAGLFSILKWGFNYSIDFVGGTNLEYQLDKSVKESDVEALLKKEKIEIVDVTVDKNVLSIRTKPLEENKEVQLISNMEKDLGTKVTVLRSETVGPTLGKETLMKTLFASFLAIIGILLYIAFAFKSFNFALAAIVALLHDFLVLVGSYSLLSHFFGAQLDTLFVTAVLTTMSFSVHDTIVIFDKIREHRSTQEAENIEYSTNKALTETLVRSLNNSMTIIFMLLALTLLGGSTIRFFVAALLIGTLTGAYSSPFVAAPILVWLEKRRRNK